MPLGWAGLVGGCFALVRTIENGPDLVILNKFGKTEAEGQGLRDTLAQAVQLGVTAIVGVPYRNIEQWRIFAEYLADECGIGNKGAQCGIGERGWFR